MTVHNLSLILCWALLLQQLAFPFIFITGEKIKSELEFKIDCSFFLNYIFPLKFKRWFHFLRFIPPFIL